MIQPELPVELCEEIIDLCAQDVEKFFHSRSATDRDFYVSLATLRACALTCKAWLPRSLASLVRIVELCGDVRTRNMAYGLDRHSQSLDLQIHYLSIRMVELPMPDSDGVPYYLVPYYLATRKANIQNLQTLRIITYRGPTPLWQVSLEMRAPAMFLPSLAVFRSVHTLILQNINIYSFRYFLRLILSFSALKHLTLIVVSVVEPTDTTLPLRIRKIPSLRSLRMARIGRPLAFALTQWVIRNPKAIRDIECLEAGSISSFYPDLHPLLQTIVTGSGASLKALVVETVPSSTPGEYLDLKANTSLKTLHMIGFNAVYIHRSLNSISSRDLSLLTLDQIILPRSEIFRFTMLDGLTKTLLSDTMISRLYLCQVALNIEPDPSFGTPVDREVFESEVEKRCNPLKKKYGERLKTTVLWRSAEERKDFAIEMDIREEADRDPSAPVNSGTVES